MTSQTPPDEEIVGGITVPYRVRFDEAGPDGVLRASTLLRYAQDCAWIHSERLGFGRDWYAARGLTWVVRSIELTILERITTDDRLAISTAVIGFRRVWARRRTLVRDAADRLVAALDTDFVMTDIERGLPARVPEDFPRLFGVAPGTFEPHRVAIGTAPATAARIAFIVRPQELDPLGHANNAAYLDWLEEAVDATPGGSASLTVVPRTYRLEYVAAAQPAMELVSEAWPDPSGGIAYRLTSEGVEVFRATVRGAAPGDAGASARGSVA
jgi:acyl-CoA thioesterase FadM